jgi:hypothetical protein
LIGYYLPDIQLSQRGRIEKISIKVAGSIYRACEQARGAPDIVSGRIIRPDSDKIVLSGIRSDIYYYPAGYRIICFSRSVLNFR